MITKYTQMPKFKNFCFKSKKYDYSEKQKLTNQMHFQIINSNTNMLIIIFKSLIID